MEILDGSMNENEYKISLTQIMKYHLLNVALTTTFVIVVAISAAKGHTPSIIYI